MNRRIPPLAAALLLTACGSESTPSEKTAVPSATLSATSTATTPQAGDRTPTVKAAKAKAFVATAEQDLGTLPPGVGIPVGDTAPDFELPAVEGGKVKLSELIAKSEVMLVFYRGGW